MTYRKWGQMELDFIKNNFNTVSDDILAAKLSEMTNSSITTPMIRRQRRKLGIQKPRGRQPKNKNTVGASDNL